MGMSPRLLRPRATGFNPRSIAGLELWLDANDSSTITISTGVSAWADKSGKGRNFSQAIANNRPIVSAVTQNGRALLEFDGSNDQLTQGSNFMQVSNCTLFAAFRRLGGTFGGIISSATDSDRSPAILIESSSVAVRGHANLSRASTAAADTFNITSGRVDGGASTLWINGTQRDSDAVSSTLDTSGTTTAIGTYRQAAANYTYGYIGEIVFYARVLTTADRQTVESYLGKKWGVTVT